MTSGAVTADGRARVLADGSQCLCSASASGRCPRAECVNAVRWALDLGIAISTRPRLTATRRAWGGRCATAACRETRCLSPPSSTRAAKTPPPKPAKPQAARRRPGQPVPGPLAPGRATWAWPGMERARERGFARSVGVSNFSAGELAEVIAAGTIPPAVNQVEFSAMEHRRGLLDAAGAERRTRGLQSAGNWPASLERDGEPGRPAGRTHTRPGAAAMVPSARGSVISKSTHRERIGQNAQIFDFALSSEDVAELDALDQTNGTDRALENKWW